MTRKVGKVVVTQTSPRLDEELRRRREARTGPATEADASRRVSTLPPHRPPKIHEGQLTIQVSRTSGEWLYRAYLVYRRDGDSWREWGTARACRLR